MADNVESKKGFIILDGDYGESNRVTFLSKWSPYKWNDTAIVVVREYHLENTTK